MLRDSVAIVVAAVMHTRPRAVLLAMITMRKSTHGFRFVSHMTMGLCLVAQACRMLESNILHCIRL